MNYHIKATGELVGTGKKTGYRYYCRDSGTFGKTREELQHKIYTEVFKNRGLMERMLSEGDFEDWLRWAIATEEHIESSIVEVEGKI